MNTVDNDLADRYPLAVVVLHWTIALLVVVLLATGWYMVDIPTGTPARGFFYNLHKSLGIVAAIFIVVLIIYRLRHAAPDLPSSMPKWERSSAALNHGLFYIFMVLVTLAGYATSSFSKYGPKLFGMPLPHWGWDDAALRSQFAMGHRLSSLVFAVLIAIHIGAALKHLLVDKDRVFERMMPGSG
jgi:cytochrome b561